MTIVIWQFNPGQLFIKFGGDDGRILAPLLPLFFGETHCRVPDQSGGHSVLALDALSDIVFLSVF